VKAGETDVSQQLFCQALTFGPWRAGGGQLESARGGTGILYTPGGAALPDRSRIRARHKAGRDEEGCVYGVVDLPMLQAGSQAALVDRL
jgi:hypothetical protein